MSNFDRRYLPIENSAIKAEGNTVTGLAVVYNSPSKPLNFNRSTGTFTEVIAQGAGSQVIQGDTVALFDHKTENPLGRTGANLTLSDSPQGIVYSLELPDTSLGKDIRELVKSGILRGASFFLDVPKGGDSWAKKDGQLVRTINRLNSLPEISLVMSPAYPDTSAALRSFEAFTSTLSTGQLETLNKHRQLIINRLSY